MPGVDIATEAGRTLITQGVGWALAVVVFFIFGGLSLYLYRESNKARETCEAKTAELHQVQHQLNEKRLAEALKILDALNGAAVTLKALGDNLQERGLAQSDSMKAIGAAVAQLSTAVGSLAQDFTQWKQQLRSEQASGQQFWSGRLENLEARLADTLARVEKIQAKVGAFG